MFQSRYRAASHFRLHHSRRDGALSMFQSRYRAASHFRHDYRFGTFRHSERFNLVIERLLISGGACYFAGGLNIWFQSRYRAASHFRVALFGAAANPNSGFNLVIERLLISGALRFFQKGEHPRFNLVIERLLISGSPRLNVTRIPSRVSISLSSGFSFQVVPEEKSSRTEPICFNLVIERLLISGLYLAVSWERITDKFQSRYRAASHFRFKRLEWKQICYYR